MKTEQIIYTNKNPILKNTLIKKSSKFWISIILTFILIIIYIGQIEIVFLIFSPAWIYAIYNFFIYILHKKFSKIQIRKKDLKENPKVVVFYTTKDDFCEEAFLSLVRLNYVNKEIYILDDSENEKIRKIIDEYAIKYNAKVIRRNSRKGFKAGAINNALKYIDKNAKYLLIADADELVPKDFIENLLRYFIDNRIAYVQAKHRAYIEYESNWLKAMKDGVDTHWDYYQNYRNVYGFVPFLGHGAIIDIEKLREVGGMPEFIAEDLALSIKLRNNGYYGIFANDIVAFEKFPENYRAFRKRHKKWIMGNTELLIKMSKDIIFGKMKWFEKIDIYLNIISMFFTIFLIQYTILNIWSLTNFNIPLFIITVLTIISPSLPLIKKGIKSIFFNAITYMSIFILTFIYLIKSLIKVDFPVTGDKKKQNDYTLYIDIIFSLIFLILSPLSLIFWITIITPILEKIFTMRYNAKL